MRSRGDPLVVDGEPVALHAPLITPAKAPWMPEYFLDKDYRVGINGRTLLEGAPDALSREYSAS
jgi:hypothetical protein